MVEHGHLETAGAAGHLLANPSHAQDAKGAAVDLAAQHVRRVVAQEMRAAGVAVALDQPAPGRHQQGESLVRGSAVEHARRVPDQNLPGRGGSQVGTEQFHVTYQPQNGAHCASTGTPNSGTAVSTGPTKSPTTGTGSGSGGGSGGGGHSGGGSAPSPSPSPSPSGLLGGLIH